MSRTKQRDAHLLEFGRDGVCGFPEFHDRNLCERLGRTRPLTDARSPWNTEISGRKNYVVVQRAIFGPWNLAGKREPSFHTKSFYVALQAHAHSEWRVCSKSPLELADALGLNPKTVNQHLTTLEDLGMIARAPHHLWRRQHRHADCAMRRKVVIMLDVPAGFGTAASAYDEDEDAAGVLAGECEQGMWYILPDGDVARFKGAAKGKAFFERTDGSREKLPADSEVYDLDPGTIDFEKIEPVKRAAHG